MTFSDVNQLVKWIRDVVRDVFVNENAVQKSMLSTFGSIGMKVQMLHLVVVVVDITVSFLVLFVVRFNVCSRTLVNLDVNMRSCSKC